MEPEKIVLGKPVTQKDAYNTGYLDAQVLNEFLKQSKSDKNNPGWKPSVMFWHFLSDADGKNLAKVMEGL